jgi:metal-dependent hydrolase (beta-lactamase superfamily II)
METVSLAKNVHWVGAKEEDLFRNVSRFLPVEKLDYVVINHSEPDHAGGIVELLKRNPKVTVFLSRSAKSFVDHLVNAEYSFHIVKDNEELPLGGSCTGRTPSSRISSRTRFSSRAIFSGRTTAAPSSSTTKFASRKRCARRSSSITA